MPSAIPPSLKKPADGSGKLWVVSALLFVSVVICYIDRSNLGTAAPLLRNELGLSDPKLGMVLSAFFWTYALFQLVSGPLVDRYNASWVMAGGFLLWSIVTAATGWAASFAGLFLLRLLLGIAESVAYPAYAKIFATHFTEAQRGLANSLIDVGCKFGPALGTIAGGLYMAHFGWRPFFIILGLGALPWLPCWIKWMPRGSDPVKRAVGSGPHIGIEEILGKKAAWATFVGLFCGNYFQYFLITWLPSYLVRERHLTMERMGLVGALPFLCSATGTIAAGLLSYRALANGYSPTRVRKTCTVGGLGFAAMIIAVPAIESTRGAMAILMLASFSYGVFTTSPWAIAQTIAGPLAAGRWAGLQNFIGNLSGVAAPALTGIMVARTGHFFCGIALTAAVALTGSATYLFGLGHVEPAKWRYQASS